MVQYFSYFEHIQIVGKLEPTNFLAEITTLPVSFSRGNFASITAVDPDVPVNMVATHYRTDGERSMYMYHDRGRSRKMRWGC